MKNAYTVRTAIRRIRKYKPTTPEEFARIGVPLSRHVEAGAFREVMKARDLPLVLKFPLWNGSVDGYRYGKCHSTTEVKRIKRLNKFPFMRKYLPKIYYHDRKSGMLMMRWYDNFEDSEDAYFSLGKMAAEMIYRLTGIKLIDIHDDNTRTPDPHCEYSRTVLIDIGY